MHMIASLDKHFSLLYDLLQEHVADDVDYKAIVFCSTAKWGVPADRQQYIHRLSRTGHKGKEGKGILLLAPWEDFFLHSIKDLPMTKAFTFGGSKHKQEEKMTKESAYLAWLGYYNSVKNVSKDKHRLVELAQEFSRSIGLYKIPSIPRCVVNKMGLANIPRLRAI
ncbi:DEAD-box ATP-dependent RNA helicase 25 [Hibiscus syriacus]|uniref:ATP-dependent RNA helicase n=1 Tax=Hibiscus syriacus TaxID=106335 RepID=A0A6A2XVM0_HIBSY|nr:DEAD-box ATP-dependent RNA helicase 25 [Hibiscus syriacus]